MSTNTTQSFVPVKEIVDGIIIRDDGMLCSIILVSALNFNLKSADERTAILFQFQSLLNSLEMGTQIVIQSRRLNIKPYIKHLENLYEAQTTELLKLQTKEYINFIKNFTEKHEIMTKQFFVVVKYSSVGSKEVLLPFSKKNKKDKEQKFEEKKSQLLQRVSFLQNNIRSPGLRAVQLGSEEITELLYQTFNPGDTQTPPSI